MGRRIRVKIKRSGIQELMTSEGATELVTSKAAAIAQACNSQSTWGGYFSSGGNGLDGTSVGKDGRRRGAGGRFVGGGLRARAKVWSADRRNDEARDQRLVRNLDAE